MYTRHKGRDLTQPISPYVPFFLLVTVAKDKMFVSLPNWVTRFPTSPAIPFVVYLSLRRTLMIGTIDEAHSDGCVCVYVWDCIFSSGKAACVDSSRSTIHLRHSIVGGKNSQTTFHSSFKGLFWFLLFGLFHCLFTKNIHKNHQLVWGLICARSKHSTVRFAVF